MFTLELMGPVLGFDDTDNPAVSLHYLRQYPQFYALAAVAVFIMALAYIVASFAISDVLTPRTSMITRRSLSALGLFAAAFLFMHGVLRESVGPLLYIDSVNRGWGESAYLTIQMLGTHGFLAAGLITLAVWSVGICLVRGYLCGRGSLPPPSDLVMCLGISRRPPSRDAQCWAIDDGSSDRPARDLARLHGTDPSGNASVADPRRGAACQVPPQSRAATCQFSTVNHTE